MANDATADFGPVITELLARDGPMALDPGQADPARLERLGQLGETELLAPAEIHDATMAKACLSGLWLRHDGLDQAHRIAQHLHTASGAYWHALMHRREGDYPNAKYWFGQAGAHPIHGDLNAAAHRLASAVAQREAEFLETQPTWDPGAFVDLCEAVCLGRSQTGDLCRAIQEQEWQLLFAFCHRHATSPG